MPAPPGDNRWVEKKASSGAPPVPAKMRDPFLPGTLVIVNLGNPREKFWGMILSIAPSGVNLSGVDLASFEDIAAMAREGEPFHPAIVFFPMHRIERVVLDVHDGSLSSLAERFFAKTGLEPIAALSDHLEDIQVQKLRPHLPKERA
jgi:hypothetical protein